MAGKEIDPSETRHLVPEYLSSYVAPEELGNDIASGVIEIENKLYRLPSPMSEFIADGWTIDEGIPGIPAGGSEIITLRKGKKTISVSAGNLAGYQTTAKNCAVTSVYVETPVNASLSGGPNIGMFKQYINSYEAFDDTHSYIQYDPYINASFDFDKTTDKVNCLELTCTEWDY